jgi:hypothetical protein
LVNPSLPKSGQIGRTLARGRNSPPIFFKSNWERVSILGQNFPKGGKMKGVFSKKREKKLM